MRVVFVLALIVVVAFAFPAENENKKNNKKTTAETTPMTIPTTTTSAMTTPEPKKDEGFLSNAFNGVKDFFGGVVDKVKGLFGGGPAPPVATTPMPNKTGNQKP